MDFDRLGIQHPERGVIGTARCKVPLGGAGQRNRRGIPRLRPQRQRPPLLRLAQGRRDDSFKGGADGASGWSGRPDHNVPGVRAERIVAADAGQAIAERCKTRRSSRFTFRRMRLRTGRARLRLRSNWERCWRRMIAAPSQADDDRIGGWQLMYQLLEQDAWVITENCGKLIECLPQWSGTTAGRGCAQGGRRRSSGRGAVWNSSGADTPVLGHTKCARGGAGSAPLFSGAIHAGMHWANRSRGK